MKTDTSEKGLESLIVADMTGQRTRNVCPPERASRLAQKWIPARLARLRRCTAGKAFAGMTTHATKRRPMAVGCRANPPTTIANMPSIWCN